MEPGLYLQELFHVRLISLFIDKSSPAFPLYDLLLRNFVDESRRLHIMGTK